MNFTVRQTYGLVRISPDWPSYTDAEEGHIQFLVQVEDDDDDEDDGNDNHKDNEDDEDDGNDNGDDNGNDNEDDIPYTSKRRILKKVSKEVSKIKQSLKNFLEGDDSESSQSRLRPKRGRDDQDDYMKEKKRLRTGAESNEKGMELDDSWIFSWSV